MRRSGIATDFWDSPAKSRSRGRVCYAAIAKLPSANKVFDQLLTWPADQPRHATTTSTYPVESNSPPLVIVSSILSARWPDIPRFVYQAYAGREAAARLQCRDCGGKRLSADRLGISRQALRRSPRGAVGRRNRRADQNRSGGGASRFISWLRGGTCHWGHTPL